MTDKNEIKRLQKALLEQNLYISKLLKEKEAVEPLSEHHIFICPMCKDTLLREQKYCKECGKSILWEDTHG